jgi:hypothetical protein
VVVEHQLLVVKVVQVVLQLFQALHLPEVEEVEVMVNLLLKKMVRLEDQVVVEDIMDLEHPLVAQGIHLQQIPHKVTMVELKMVMCQAVVVVE